MPLTDEEIDSLIAEGKTDEQILAIGQTLDKGFQPMGPEAGADIAGQLGKAGLGGRAASGIQTAFEATGVPSILRTAGAAQRGQMPAGMDMAGTALAAIPGLALGRAGVPATKIAGGLAKGALGAGAGTALLGPEAEALGYRIGGERGAAIGAALPAIAGGLAGPGLMDALGKLGKAGVQLPLKGAQAARQTVQSIKPDLPIAGRQAAMLESGEAMTPEGMAQVQAFQQRTGIKPTPGQAQFLESGMAETPIKGTEYRLKQSGPALNIGKEQAQQFGKYAEGTFEEMAPGAARPAAAIGSEIQGQAIQRLKEAGTRYEAAENAVLNAPEASKITLDYVKNLKGAVKGITDEFKAPGGKSALPPEVQTVLKQIEPWTKTAGNLKDAVQFRRIMKGLKAKFQPGTPEYGAVTQLDKAVDDAIQQSATKAQKGPLKNFFEASRNYYQMKYSPEAELVESLSGVNLNRLNALPAKTPEDVVKKIFTSPANLAPRIMEAAGKGNIAPESVRSAAANYLLSTVQSAEGGIDYGKLAKAWNALPDSQKTVLFGDWIPRIDRLVKDAEALTFVGRYKPPTGASLPTLLPGLETAVQGVAGLLPGGIGRMATAAAGQGMEKVAALSHFNRLPEVAVKPTGAMRAAEAALIGGEAALGASRGTEQRIKNAREKAQRLARGFQ